MYGFFDESGSTSNAVGFTESSMVVQEDTRPCLSDRPNQVLQRHIKDVKYRGNNSSQAIASELDEFLRCDDNTGREMVAQDMAESYNELFHTAQEPQEFHSLDELGPRAHQSVSTSDTSAHLYVSAQGDSQSQQSEPQQRTYYNLSTLSDSSSIYFGDIRQSGSSRLQAGEALASKATPGAPLSPARADIYQEHQSASKSDYNNSSCNSNITSVTTLDGKNNNGNANDVCQRSRPVITSSPHLRRFAPTSLSRRGSASIMQSSSSSHREHLHHHHHHHHHHRHHQHQESVHSGARSTDLAEDYPTTKKRKISLHDENDLLEDTTDDSKSARTSAGNKKQNHSEIEKRRRDKMNTYITELSSLVPMCHAMSRKLDKLTVLRMAVQHIKTILGAANSYTEGHYKPAFLSDQELKTLILQAADGFVFVVGCDRGRILYVSESVSQTLNYSQDDLLGQSWFDILHPKDVAKVKEQLSSSDLSPRERLIDAKTMLPVKTDVPQGMSRLCSGARRSFFCRMKRKVESSCGESQVKEEAETTTGCHRTKKQQNADWKYSVIQCTGYLKSWAPAKIGLEEEEGSGDGEASNLSSLVAVGRVQPNLTALTPGARMPRLRTIEFVSRHAIDGKFLFVDQRATLVLGFLPQELLGTSMYEYYHHDDIPHLAESHKAALQTSERVNTQVYRFRVKGASFVRLQSEWKSFKNPWTKDIEYLIAKNSAIFYNARQVESTAYRSDGSSVQGNYDYFTQSNGGLERLISSHVEVSKIGRRIAKEALDHQKRCEDSSSTSSPNPAQDSVLLNTEITTTTSPEGIHDAMEAGVGSDNSSSNISPTYHHIRNNVTLNSMINDQGEVDTMMDIIGSNVINESSDPLPSDGNDEAAMAVIMSLLEADAGLGGPVDFSGLPWPLP